MQELKEEFERRLKTLVDDLYESDRDMYDIEYELLLLEFGVKSLDDKKKQYWSK